MEYVVSLVRPNDQLPINATLSSAYDVYVEQLAPGRGGRGEVEEMRAASERLIALRDNLGLAEEKVRVHVCLHDEGIGSCTAVDL